MAPVSDPLFREAAEEFLLWAQEERRLAPSTCYRYERILRGDLLRPLGRLRLSAITEEMILTLRGKLAKRLSASSLNQTKAVLAGIVRRARKNHRYKGQDFSRFFEYAHLGRGNDIEVYSPEEVELLAQAALKGAWRQSEPRSEYQANEQAYNSWQDAAFYRVAAYTGLRVSELRALQWRDLDFAGAKILVRRAYSEIGGEGPPKSGKARSVPMAARVRAELERLYSRPHFKAKKDLVFGSLLGGRLDDEALRKRFRATARAAGLRELRLHDLRHGAATLFVQQFAIHEVQAIMGHASIVTTMKYVHWIPRNDMSQQLDSLLERRLNPGPIDFALQQR